jgi:hypothetical protein
MLVPFRLSEVYSSAGVYYDAYFKQFSACVMIVWLCNMLIITHKDSRGIAVLRVARACRRPQRRFWFRTHIHSFTVTLGKRFSAPGISNLRLAAACGPRNVFARPVTWFGNQPVREGQAFSAAKENININKKAYIFLGVRANNSKKCIN